MYSATPFSLRNRHIWRKRKVGYRFNKPFGRSFSASSVADDVDDDGIFPHVQYGFDSAWAHGQSRRKQKEDCKRKKIRAKEKGDCKKRSRKKKKKVECKFWMALTGLRTTPLPYCLFHSSAGLKKWSKINRSKLYSQASLIFNCTDFVRVNFALPTL